MWTGGDKCGRLSEPQLERCCVGNKRRQTARSKKGPEPAGSMLRLIRDASFKGRPVTDLFSADLSCYWQHLAAMGGDSVADDGRSSAASRHGKDKCVMCG